MHAFVAPMTPGELSDCSMKCWAISEEMGIDAKQMKTIIHKILTIYFWKCAKFYSKL